MHFKVICAVLLPLASGLSLAGSRAERAARFLQKEGRRLDSTDLLQLGDKVRGPDDFKQVKDMIRSMIAKHQEAQADDTSHKAFCDKELQASQAKVAKMKREIEKRTADQDMHTAKLAKLKDEISDLHSGISEAHKERQKAAEAREGEAAAYEQAKADADKKMQEFRPLLRSDIEKERKAAREAQEALTLKQVQAENKEQDAQYRFKKMDGELEVAIARKTKEVEHKEHQVVSMTHDVSVGDGDFKMAQDEYDAAKEYEEKVKTSCTVRVEPAEVRARNREEQITSLKEAERILSGDDFSTYSA